MRNLANEPAVRQYADDRHGVVSIVTSGRLFRFTLDATAFEPASNGLDGYTYQTEALRSGLYGTVDEAVAAAEAEFSWVGTTLSQCAPGHDCGEAP